MSKIIWLLDQKNFKWYELSPDSATIINLEKVINGIKSHDDPNFLADREGSEYDYNGLVGSKWIYRDNKNNVFAVIICRRKQTEVMVVRDNSRGKKMIKEIEKLFKKNF